MPSQTTSHEVEYQVTALTPNVADLAVSYPAPTKAWVHLTKQIRQLDQPEHFTKSGKRSKRARQPQPVNLPTTQHSVLELSVLRVRTSNHDDHLYEVSCHVDRVTDATPLSEPLLSSETLTGLPVMLLYDDRNDSGLLLPGSSNKPMATIEAYVDGWQILWIVSRRFDPHLPIIRECAREWGTYRF